MGMLKTVQSTRHRRCRSPFTSEVALQRAVLDWVLEGVITPLDPEPAIQAWLIYEVGRSMAKLVAAAKSVSVENDAFGYVVHPGKIDRPSSLGKEPADLKELATHVISCTTLVQHLQQTGSISFEEASKAKNLLTLRGDEPSTGEQLSSGCSIFLDRLATEYLVEIGVLEPLRRENLPIYILEEELDGARQLLEYEKRADQIKANIESIRSVLTAGVESGRIVVGPADREESLGRAGHAIASALQLLDRVDALVSDDRAVNKNLAASNETTTRPIITTLDVLNRLVEREQLTGRDEIYFRHKLLEANYIFVPLRAEDLDYCLDQAVLINDKLVETAEMRILREYLVAAAMSDWLQMPGEGAWLKESQSAVRACIWRQWETAENDKVAGAKSNWLFDLFDFRDWARFRPFEGESMSSLRAVQLFLLSMPLGTMSGKARRRFLDWLDRQCVSDLRTNCPSVLVELIASVKELIERAVEGCEEEQHKTVIAVDILCDLPYSLSQALLQEKDWPERFSIPRQTVVRIAEPGPHFDQTALYDVARSALEDVGSVYVLLDKHDASWNCSSSDTYSLSCTDGTTIVDLPELRYVASLRDLRIEGLEALAKLSLPRSAMKEWLHRLERRPLYNEEITALHEDVRATPDTVRRHVEQAAHVGSFKWNEVIPTDDLYCTRLIGRPAQSQTLERYLGGGFRHWFEELPDTSNGEAVKASLLACGLGEISKEASKLFRGKADVFEIVNWATKHDMPGVRVAALEVFLPWSVEDESLRQPLAQLLEAVVVADLASESSPYRFYVDLYFAVGGHVASGLYLREHTIFYQHLYISAQVNLLQGCFSASGVDTTTLARGMREDKGFAFTMRALVDMAEWPRWHTKCLTPEMVHGDHLGRIWIAAQGLQETLPECELRNLLFGEIQNSLRPKVLFPFSYMPCPIEGSRSTVCNQSAETRMAINEQLGERPASDHTFAGLISAGMTCGVFPDQSQKASEALRSIDTRFSDMEDEDHLWIVLDGLAQIAAQSRNASMASEVVRLCRNHSSGVKESIGYANAVGIGLAASAAIEESTERFRFLAGLAEYFAFRDMSKEDCAVLVGNLAMLCRVEPDLYPFLSKSISALMAYMNSSRGT